MNYFKALVAAMGATLFAIACSQPPAAPNRANTSTNTNVGRPSAVAPANRGDAKVANISERIRDRVQAVADDVQLVAEPGHEMYVENCMICHKDTGKGGKTTIEGKTINPADLTSAKMKARLDDKLLSGIKEGVPDEGMPSFNGKLSDEDIKSIVQYLRTLQ